MEERPKSLSSSEPFPYKDELLAALSQGATLRRDDRSLAASHLAGTYKIRLRIVEDPSINGGLEPKENSLARDVATLVHNLDAEPSAEVAVWYVKGKGGVRFTLFENAQSGAFLGCFHGEVPQHKA